MDLKQYFDDIENRIIVDEEEKLEKAWDDFLDNKLNSGIFTYQRQNKISTNLIWNDVNVSDAIDDLDLMIYGQLYKVHMILDNNLGQPLLVRANYGTAILPSLFDCEVFVMDKQYNTLPTGVPFTDPYEKFSYFIENPITDINKGLVKKVFEFSNKWLELTKDYPKIKKYVHMTHPDLQSPFDVLEILAGNECFYWSVDEPEFMHSVLKVITNAYILVMDKWVELFGLHNKSYHWTFKYNGNIVLRVDSAMNFSPADFKEYFFPYNEILLNKYQGGITHFCGTANHFIEILSKHQNLTGINMTQPELNDMNLILDNTIEKNIAIYGFEHKKYIDKLSESRNLKGLIHFPNANGRWTNK